MKYKVIGWTNNDDERYPITELDSDEKYNAIVEDIRANNYKFNGWEHHEHPSCTPVLNNGKRVCCAQRAFAGLMADAHNVDNWDGRAYIYYHLTEFDDAKYPEEYVDESAIVADFDEPAKVEKTLEWDEDDLDDDIDEESRRLTDNMYKMTMLSAAKFGMNEDEFYTLLGEYDNNPALVASLLLERATLKKDILVRIDAKMAACDIIKYWLTDDERGVKDERLSHLEDKFEKGRYSESIRDLCPEGLRCELDKLNNDLLTVMYFLLSVAGDNKELLERISTYMNYLFEYSFVYDIDSVIDSVPKELIDEVIEVLKPGNHYYGNYEIAKGNKKTPSKEQLMDQLLLLADGKAFVISNEDLVRIAVGSVYYEMDARSKIHFYRCTREQMEAYSRLSKTLGEWSGRTNGVRLDFVTNSNFFGFCVDEGKKYELFVNGVKEDHIELSSGDIFKKTLDTLKGENRITLIYPSHEAGVISSVMLSRGSYFKPYKHTYGKKILFLGDSITQGWDTVSDSNSYAYQVSLRYDADTVIFGVGGAYFHESILPSEDIYHPDVVIVAFGANDYGKGIDALKENMPRFLDKLLSVYKNSQIIGLTPISGRSGRKAEKDIFREFICSTYEKYGIEYIDGSDMVSPLEENFADRYHPNDKGYLEMADKLIPRLNELIK